MQASEEQLQEIERFAYLYLSREEIALVVGLSAADLLKDAETPVGIAFQKGRIRRRADYNNSIIKLADQLSSPAQAIEAKLAQTTYLNDKK
jgi:hypothetical protein